MAKKAKKQDPVVMVQLIPELVQHAQFALGHAVEGKTLTESERDILGIVKGAIASGMVNYIRGD